MEAIIEDFSELPIGCRDSRNTLAWIRRKALTARQLFIKTDIVLTQLNSGKWRWVVRDFTDATIGYGTEDTKKLARAAAKDCKTAHQNNLKKGA